MTRRGLLTTLLLLALAPAAVAQDQDAQDPAAQDPAAPETPDAQDEPRQPCPVATFRAQLMTPMAGRIPRDAALVVGLFEGGSLRELPSISLQRRRREVAMIREAIAPGLYRLRPDARRVYGRYDVQGVEGSPQIIFGRPGTGAPPAAPRLERVERYIVANAEGSRAEVRAHFGFPIPQGVVAVLSYWGTDATPDLFTRATPSSQETVLFASSGRCAALPEGASAPPHEGQVRVAFVDLHGQVSPLSEPASLSR